MHAEHMEGTPMLSVRIIQIFQCETHSLFNSSGMVNGLDEEGGIVVSPQREFI